MNQTPNASLNHQFERDGFCVIPKVLSVDLCRQFADQIADVFAESNPGAIQGKRHQLVGGRNLIDAWDGWRNLLKKVPLGHFVKSIVGRRAGVVRILYFDKPPGQGWALSMHRDKTIAVAEHLDGSPPPFSKPTRKAGVPHVQATDSVLNKMLTLRVHLDPMTPQNGPLIVVPGSHDLSQTEPPPIKQIHSDAGAVFAMRPLLLHGSIAADAETTQHRRVLHLEIAPDPQLPGEYHWHDYVKVFPNRGIG